ncbi:MAG: hypothetical protein LBE78_09210 [Burkholderiaceae bacterium]|jgi:hypothetical protein|nr:hypothetical protein [Burkholderiaceae bacterium]
MELLRWDNAAKERTRTWFNTSDEEIRDCLMRGIAATIRVLEGLKAESFLKKTIENEGRFGCAHDPSLDHVGAVAAVCPTDVEHRILLALSFCEMRPTTRIYGSDKIYDGESQLSTLIHEVTHFADVFRSKDMQYNITESRKHAHRPNMHLNADSLTAFILGTVRG